MTRPPRGYRGPSDRDPDQVYADLVDGRARALLDRWLACFAELAWRLTEAEAGAAYGPGQADMRTYQRGGDPVTGRLDWGPDDDQPWQGPWDQRPPRLLDTRGPGDRDGDTETRMLRKLHQRMCDSLAYDVARFERELRPPEREAG